LLGAVISGIAHATTYNVTFNPSGAFEQRHDKIASGSFQDIYRFSLATPSNLTVSFKNDWKVLSNLSVFVDGSTDYGPISFAASGSPTIGTFSLLAGSNYEVRLNGTSGKDGRYTIRLTQAALPVTPPAAPVPEPAEWTMLVAGFLVIGFIARRRKRTFS
jgi:hypothetical protein